MTDLKNRDYCVSSGTLREDHLIVAFLDEYACLCPTNSAPYRLSEIADWARKSCNEKSIATWEFPEGTHDFLNDLTEELDNLAPEGYYFGSIEGDGACFGWWKYDDEAEL